MELEKLYNLLLQEVPSDAIRNNEEFIFNIIPELKNCKNFNQNSIWHIYDVYEHILHVIDNVPNNLTIRLAALFHDTGKPFTYFEDDKGIGHFYNHWIKSKEIFDAFALKYHMDNHLSKSVSNLIFYHDVYIAELNKEQLEELLKTFNGEEIKMLFELKRGDLLAQNAQFHHLLDNYKRQELDLLIKKRELIRHN